MVNSYTSTEHVYECELGSAVLHEETGLVVIKLRRQKTIKPEKVEEFGKMLCDVAATMRSR